MNNEDRQINDDAKKEFEKVKKGFEGFKDIDWVMPNDIVIKDGALPVISEEQANKNIMDAMERIYGTEDKPKEDINEDVRNKS